MIFGISIGEIFLLVSMLFALGFLLNQELGLASAQVTGDPYLENVIQKPPVASAPVASSKTFSQMVSGAFKGEAFGTTGAQGTAYTSTTGIANSLLAGVLWGAVIGGLAYMIGGMLGASKENQATLFKAGMIGGIVGGVAKYAVQAFGTGGTTTTGAMGNKLLGMSPNGFGFSVGLVAMAAIIILSWKETSTQIVTFTCMPWEAPLGGGNCADCNKDPMRPCSEYRCKSLGQACDIVNKGTDKEQCVWVSKFDVNSPTITPWTQPLTQGLGYSPITGRPVERGTSIVKNGANKCLQAFTPLKFGLITNEPAQCKSDYSPKNFSDMQFFFGGSNYYEINHTQIMSLPSPNSDNSANPLFKNDGTMDLWVQCQDANGNRNADLYLVEFCVDKSPDTTAPVIQDFSITSGSPVQYNIDQVPIEVYTNEPAQCKWSRQDKTYETMENIMNCASSALEINGNLQYTCSQNLTAIKNRENNDFYFRCIDNAGNKNMESTKLTLRGSQPLNIISMKPNSTIYGSTTTVPVSIEVTTDAGSDEGKSTCFYNGTLTSGFNEMYETDNYISRQSLDLTSGRYSYQIKCVDNGGNVAQGNVVFDVIVDKQAPQVTRVYRDQALKIVTNEDAECSYSTQTCNFPLTTGVKMEYSNINVKNQLFAPWSVGTVYYIKCIDSYGNQPLPSECSVIVTPRPLSSGFEVDNTGTIGVVTTGSTVTGNGTIGTATNS